MFVELSDRGAYNFHRMYSSFFGGLEFFERMKLCS